MRTKDELLGLPSDVTHYELLGISPESVRLRIMELTAARRKVALVMHPDRDNSTEAAEFMARANAAYDVLSDGVSTKLYLAQLRSTHKECDSCKATGLKKKQAGFNKTYTVPCVLCKGFGYIKKEGWR